MTIDGPSGSGKSTVSRALAKRLGGKLIDTGAMYRSVAYFALLEGCTNAQEYARVARGLKFRCHRNGLMLLVNGKDLGRKLRSERMSQMASHVSQFRGVRSVLTAKQRRLGNTMQRRCPVVMEGRDIGTIVFPGADYKFFVTASHRVRAERRFLQLRKMGRVDISLRQTLENIAKRDKRDTRRRVAPLRMARDSILIDTSKVDVPGVINLMIGKIGIHI